MRREEGENERSYGKTEKMVEAMGETQKDGESEEIRQYVFATLQL